MAKNNVKTTPINVKQFKKIAPYDGTPKLPLITSHLTLVKTKFEKKMEKESATVDKMLVRCTDEKKHALQTLKWLKMRFGGYGGSLLTAFTLLHPISIYENFKKCLDATPEGVIAHPDLSKLGEGRLHNFFLFPVEALANFLRIFSKIEDSPSFWTPKTDSLCKKAQTKISLFGYLLRFGKVDFTHANNMLRFLALSFYFLLRKISRIEFIYFSIPTSSVFVPPEVMNILVAPVANWPIWFLSNGEFEADLEDQHFELIEFLDDSDPDDIIEVQF